MQMENGKTTEMDSDTFNLTESQMPIFRGRWLKFAAWIVTTPIGKLIIPNILRDFGFEKFQRNIVKDPPTYKPTTVLSAKDQSFFASTCASYNENAMLENESSNCHLISCLDYARKYRSGEWNPVEVSAFLIEKIEDMKGLLKPEGIHAVYQCNKESVLKSANDSLRRLKASQPLSLLEGVPIIIKDEINVEGYITTCSSASYNKLNGKPALIDADVVERLRCAGAVILGKTAMHEFGLGVTGFAPDPAFGGTPRNPYNLNHYCGGSSSGSACALAAGIGCIAINCDTGGSGRVPFAFCGVYGLKPTFGRLSTEGTVNASPSMNTVSIAGARIHDIAVTYAICAGDRFLVNTIQNKDELNNDCNISFVTPPIASLYKYSEIEDLSDVRIGIYKPYFEYADPDIVQKCYLAVEKLQKRGAVVVDINIPELEEIRLAHLSISLSELTSHLAPYCESKSLSKLNSSDMNLTYHLGLHLNGALYMRSMQQRTRAMKTMKRLFEHVDIIATPSSAIIAPTIDKKAFPYGENVSYVKERTIRYAQLANLTGIPAMSIPIDYDESTHLPIGLQVMSSWWREDILLRVGHALESTVNTQAPALCFKYGDERL